jgi:hypothetical protein
MIPNPPIFAKPFGVGTTTGPPAKRTGGLAVGLGEAFEKPLHPGARVLFARLLSSCEVTPSSRLTKGNW